MIDTPGHTRGQINYFFPDGEVLLSGDTLFSLGCGRLIEGTAAEMFASLRKLAALPGDTLVCCGHEYTESNARFALQRGPRQRGAEGARREAQAAARRGQADGCRVDPGDELAANPFLRAPDVATFADLRAQEGQFPLKPWRPDGPKR